MLANEIGVGAPAMPAAHSMFNDHLNSQRRIVFYAHGPEWTFVIPAGDAAALRDVVTICARVWNGAGALILLADSNGDLAVDGTRYLSTRFRDEVWLHPQLTTEAQKALTADVELGPQLWNSQHAFSPLHPADLLSEAALPEQRVSMTRPDFESPSLDLMTDVVWGVIENPDAWRDRFDLGVMGGADGFLPLVRDQLGFGGASPLRVTQVAMEVFGQWQNHPWPWLWVFEDGTVDELVAFWNFRSGAAAWNRLASVVGIPREALSEPKLLEDLATWARHSDRSLRPSFFVNAAAGLLPEVEETLGVLGLARLAGDEQPRSDHVSADDAVPTWLPGEPVPNGRILRGAWDSVELVVRAGETLLTLPRPRSYRPRGGVRLVLQSMPTPLPITRTTAGRMLHGGYAHPRGLAINMATASPWPLTIAIPDETTALTDWAADYGYAVEEPPAGKDGRALLERLGDLSRLDALANEVALELLAKLAPLTRDRLIGKLVERFSPSRDISRVLDELRDMLRSEELLLTVDARTLEQLKSTLPSFSDDRLMAALEALVGVGFVHRGRNVKCPTCHYGAFLLLRELDEEIRCGGCGRSYALPVRAANGKEAPLAYRLDGLMARLMERHVLPVILTLRALHASDHPPRPDHIWPGMLFNREGSPPTDVDLLTSDGAGVVAAECKLDARRLGRPQVDKLLQFTAHVGGIAVIAALNGDFNADVEKAVRTAGGTVLKREDLLTA